MADSNVAITPTQQMVASCSGAMLTSLLVTPLDVVKIRLQAQRAPITQGSCFLYCNGLTDHLYVCPCNENNGGRKWYARPGHFTGTLDAMIKITRAEGVTSLWSGLPPTLIMAIPSTVVYYTSYDRLKYYLGYRENDPTTRYIPLIAGPVARVGAATLTSPLEMARTKLQSEQLSYRHLVGCIRDAVRQQGVHALWRGLGPTLLRDVPFSALYWFMYESIKAHQLATSTHRSTLQTIIAGALAGTVAGIVTLPFDVIKTHRQITLGDNIAQTRESSSTWTAIRRLYQQRGVPALFAGLVPRVVRVAPACAIMITSYEFSKDLFLHHNEDQAAKS